MTEAMNIRAPKGLKRKNLQSNDMTEAMNIRTPKGLNRIAQISSPTT